MRARFSTSALVALVTLTTGALGIAVTLATTDSAKWPAWLQPYHGLGWSVVLALLLAVAVLSGWQYARQSKNSPDNQPPTRVLADESGPAAGQDVTITGGQGPTAGRDVHSVIGGQGPTAGRDVYIGLGAGGPPVARSASEVRWPTPDEPVSNLGPRNPAFTGRDQLLADLGRDLTSSGTAALVRATAIHGLGGIGKTQLVLEYAHRHTSDYDLIWWVTADQPAAISGQLAALARRLNILEAADQAETVAVLLDELRRHGRWLLIFDNAEHPRDLQPYWPAGGRGHVLVTSRNPSWSGWAATVEVDVLARAESVAFLGRRLRRDESAFDRLAEALGDLPLALEQAAAYLEEAATTVGDYLGLLATRADELLKLGRPVTTEQTITTVWSVSIQHLRAQTLAAEELLRLCSFLAPDDIPRPLVTDHGDALPEPLGSAVRDRLGFQLALAALRRYSLITTSPDGRALSVHRLVQAVTRQQLEGEQERHAWAQGTVELLRRAFPADPDEPSAWPRCSQLLTHVLAATNYANDEGVAAEISASLLTDTGVYLRAQAQLGPAQTVLEQALAIRNAALGADHPDVAVTLTHLGTVLRRRGEPASARRILQQALEITERAPGPDRRDEAKTLTHLGTALRDCGNLKEARAVLERALAIREAALGADHPDVALTRTYLGTVLRRLGEPASARSVLEQARESYEKAHELEHPRLAVTLAHLGHTLRDLGDLTGARAAHERALAIRQGVYHEQQQQHPEVAFALRDLGRTLRDAGDLAAARSHVERAIAIFETTYGAEHPDTATSRNDLGLVLRGLGELVAARDQVERALVIREARLGADHPTTATSLYNLAVILHDQDDLDGARRLHERALAIREAHLGPDHPDTASSRRLLADLAAESEDAES